MRTLLITVFLSLFLSALAAQTTTLTGRIMDGDTREGLISATVRLFSGEKLVAATLSGIEGQYRFGGLKAGKYVVEVSYVGYTKVRSEKIKVFSGQANTVDIVMLPAAVLDEVVVVGYAVPLIEQDNTSQSQTISREDMAASSDRKEKRRERRPKKISRTHALTAAPATMARQPAPRAQIARTYGTESARPADGRIPGNATDPVSGEQYNEIKENDFIRCKDEAISTLSTDVDRAAYANVRGLINAGREVPKDAVRIEEMINYFRYNDPFPSGKDPVAARTELTECPWNPEHQLLRIGVRARGMALADAPASNVVFLVDVSGSMNSANKLPLVVKGLQMLVNNLREQDRVSIVVYAGAAGLVLPPTSGADGNKIIEALGKLRAGGSTAGGAGIKLAYKTARENFIQGGNNRVILVTDGDFNVGTSSQEGLVQLIEKERESGVFLTVIGCGRGNLQDGKMQELADRGNGNHGYLDSYAEARKLLVDEFGGTVYTVAKDVKLQIEFNPEKVAGYRLIGYENRLLNTEDFDDDTKDAAEMGAGHVVTVLYEIEPAKKANKSEHDLAELRLRYKQPDGNRSSKMTWPVSGVVQSFGQASEDIRWAAAVAEFGLLLRGSAHKGNATYGSCAEHAKAAKGRDPFGYRNEMIGLIEAVAKKK